MSDSGKHGLKNKVAVITGGAGGFGRTVARYLLDAGSDVVLLDISEDSLKNAVRELSNTWDKSHAKVSYKICDANSEDELSSAILDVQEEKMKIDIAVSIVGTGIAQPILFHDTQEFKNHMLGNIMPAFLLMKHGCKAMKEGGSYIAVSSINAICPESLLSAYCSGKSALDALVRVGAKELGPLGIRVNSIRPGLTRTPATKELFESEIYVNCFVSQQAIKRAGRPEDVAALIKFLAGPDAGWITGQNISVDGGISLHGIPKPEGRSLLYSSAPPEWQIYMQ